MGLCLKLSFLFLIEDSEEEKKSAYFSFSLAVNVRAFLSKCLFIMLIIKGKLVLRRTGTAHVSSNAFFLYF